MELINKIRNCHLNYDRMICTLEIIFKCINDEENLNKFEYVKSIYNSLENQIQQYEENNSQKLYNILDNDFYTVESVFQELKEDVIQTFKIASIVMLDNMKYNELKEFQNSFFQIMTKYSNINQASTDIFYHSGREMSNFMIKLVDYLNTHEVINKKFIPNNFLEKNKYIVTLSFPEWMLIFKNLRSTMKYLNQENDAVIINLRKDFTILNVYYFIVITGGDN